MPASAPSISQQAVPTVLNGAVADLFSLQSLGGFVIVTGDRHFIDELAALGTVNTQSHTPFELIPPLELFAHSRTRARVVRAECREHLVGQIVTLHGSLLLCGTVQ